MKKRKFCRKLQAPAGWNETSLLVLKIRLQTDMMGELPLISHEGISFLVSGSKVVEMKMGALYYRQPMGNLWRNQRRDPSV